MPFISRKISYGFFKRTFLFLLFSGFFLLAFYVYYEKSEVALDYIRSEKKLHPQLFKNASQPIQPQECLFPEMGNEDLSIIVISSASSHRLRRQIIRTSWAQHRVISDLHFKVIFIIEEANDGATLMQHNLESEMFGDIVRTHLIESFSPLVHKTMIGLQWSLAHCPIAKFIIKVDDDVFVNPFALRIFLDNLHTSPIRYSNAIKKSSSHPDRNTLKTHDHRQSNIKSYPLHSANINSRQLQTPMKQNRARDLKFVISSHQPSLKHRQLLTAVYNTPLKNREPDILSNSDSIASNLDKNIFCFVWQNSSNTKDINSEEDTGQYISKSKNYVTYCSNIAYILPKNAASALVNAHTQRNSSHVFLDEGLYVTGILAANVSLNHVQIGSRYTFDKNNIADIANGDIIFMHLGKDTEALSNFIWNRVEDEQYRIKLFNTADYY